MSEDQRFLGPCEKFWNTPELLEKLLPYLTANTDSYDAKYALRLCVDSGLVREAVYLYSLLGQHETAVDLALSLDIELAASCAGGGWRFVWMRIPWLIRSVMVVWTWSSR